MRTLTIALLLGCLSLAGCGGGSGTSSVTIDILSTAALDGFVTSSGTVTAVGPTLAAGDEATNVAARLFVSFSLAGIPAGANITGATLILRQTSVTGTPYADLGTLVADHLDYGGTLDVGDYGLAAISAAFGVLSSTPTLELKALDVESRVEADIAALRVRSQFRARYGAPTDGGADADFVVFPSGDAAVDQPVLRVTYEP
jgi:hypothetical protein